MYTVKKLLLEEVNENFKVIVYDNKGIEVYNGFIPEIPKEILMSAIISYGVDNVQKHIMISLEGED